MKMIRFLMIAVVVLGLAIPAMASDPQPRGTWTPDTTWTPRTYAPLSDLYDEDFADIFLLEVPPPAGPGWTFVNNSDPIGARSWFQGATNVFLAQAGAPNSYLGGNYEACGTGGAEEINLWGVTGEFDLSNVAEISFWTRGPEDSSYPDRLELRLCDAGAGACDNVGVTSNDVGDFTTLLVEVNPTLAVGGYPEEWTKFTATGPWSGTGRFAFRYWVTSAGPVGVNSNYIGIDTLQVSSTGGGDGGGDDGGGPVPATTTWGVIVLIALFLGITLFYLRKRSTAGA